MKKDETDENDDKRHVEWRNQMYITVFFLVKKSDIKSCNKYLAKTKK